MMFLAAAGASLVACGDEAPAPATVRQGLSQNLAAVLPEVVAALESEGSARVPLAEATDMFDMFDGQADLVATLTESPAARKLAAVGDQLDNERTAGWLTRNVFSDANHQGDGVYRIPAAVFCSEGADPTTGDPTGAVNPDCAASMDKIAPKIKVRGDESELEFSLLLGPSSNEPLSLTLSKKAVALHLDLGETADAVAELTDLFGGQKPNLRAAGRVAVGLEVLGAEHVAFKGTIERAVDLAFADPGVSLDSAAALRLSSAAAPVYTLEIDGVAQTVTSALALGETRLHAPADDLDPETNLDLPGLSGALTVTPGQPVKITGLSLGKRTLTVDAGGRRAMTVDLNPDHGRSFDVTVTENAGAVSFAVSPRLDLRMEIDRAALGEEVRPYEVSRLLLDGTSPTLTFSSSSLQLSSGHLGISTTPAQYGLEANAGQCLAETVVSGTTTKLSVVACPQ